MLKIGNAKKNALTGTALADQLFGLGADDVLFGLAGADLLDGGLGRDTMRGGLGNDIYVVSQSNDRVIELANQGIDLVRSTVSFTLGANVEKLALFGTGNLNGIGNALHNTLTGNSGKNTLNGGLGNDTLDGRLGADTLSGGAGFDKLFGGAGNDILFGGPANDLLVGGAGADLLAGGSGIDTASYSGSTGSIFYFEGNTGLGSGDVRGDGLIGIEIVVGTNFADTMVGDSDVNAPGVTFRGLAGKDTMSGGGGSDTLEGGAGDDILNGGSGNDVLRGAAGNDLFFAEGGADVLAGGAGVDRYVYFLSNDAGLGAGARDVITDFVPGEDRIDLRGIDGNLDSSGDQSFAFVGASAASGGQLGYQKIDNPGTANDVTVIQGQLLFSGTGILPFEIELRGLFDLTGADFLL